MGKVKKALLKLIIFSGVILSAILMLMSFTMYSLVVVSICVYVFWIIFKLYFEDDRYYARRRGRKYNSKSKIRSLDILIGLSVLVALIALGFRFVPQDNRLNNSALLAFGCMLCSTTSLCLARFDLNKNSKKK